ncbi:MAG: SurA N-terminal domain-containing protein, partial [Pyrinomonadaceae bacterium]
MLKQLSRLERTRSLVIIIFAVLMGLSLVFFYAPNRSANATPATSTETLAAVNGEEITVSDFTLRKDNLLRNMQQFGGQISLAQMGLDDRRLLDGLIRDRIVSQEAARLGLAPSDAEVADAIRKRFSDASGKFVGMERYRSAVVDQYGDIARFEQQMRDTVAAQKLRAYITAGVSVSDKEVQEDYQRQNTTFDIVYVPVVADKLAKSINPSDEELQKYYNEHKEEFRISEPQKRVRYLFIDQAKVGEKLRISDEELRNAFN